MREGIFVRIGVAFALCALLAFGAPAFADDAKPLTAILLTARSDLPDPNFRDSVVLVTNNLGPGPLGLIVNRPTKMAVASLFPEIANLAGAQAKVYFGGPVHVHAVSFLFRAGEAPEQASAVLDGVYMSTNLELLRKLLARDAPMEGLRIFIGHSGWAPGQLEAEIARGDWKLGKAAPDAIFDAKPEHPWPERQAPGSGHRG